MEAHSCQHCSQVIIDLPDDTLQYNTPTLGSTLEFEVNKVKTAVQDGCKFFRWALAVDVELVREDDGEDYLNDYLANLPGVFEGNDSEDGASSDAESMKEDEIDGSSVESDHHEGNMYDPDESSDLEEKHSSAGKHLLHGDISTKMNEAPDSKYDMGTLTQMPEPQLKLNLECHKMVPGRYRLKRDMVRSDKISARRRHAHSWEGPELDFVAPLGSKLKKHIKTRPITRSPSSPESFKMASSWLHTCLENHSHAHTYEYDRMPIRLLRVHSTKDGHLDACILPTTKHETCPYLALSYSWGGDQHHKTTEKTMLDTEGAVDVSRLPGTIQDAITVTINLGYSYLWVDSVCIIQDNEKDRTAEIAKMPAIYSNAVCTITASFPARAVDGFLSDRVQYTENTMELRVKYTSEEEDRIIRNVYAYTIESDDELVVEPLAERGWSLQERLLSVRLLEYRRNQVHFLCPFTDDYDETRSDGWTFDWPQNGKIWFPKSADGHVPATLLGWEINTAEHFQKIWFSIVEAYTERKLTFARDRTLAISGIAQRIATMDRSGSSDTYIAGHWLSLFPLDLLWFSRCPDWTSNQSHMRRRPTWAWTSIDNEINAPEDYSFYPSRSAVELVDFTVQLQDNSAPFGDVETATLTVKGHTSTAECRVFGDYFPRVTMLHSRLTGQELGEAHLDAMTGPEDKDHTLDVTLLLTEISEEGKSISTAGLIVAEETGSSGRRRFVRLGAWNAEEILEGEDGVYREAKFLQSFYESDVEIFDLV